MKEITEGSQVRINREGDISFDAEARKFIGKKCIVLKTTKAGLIQVRLNSNPKDTMSFPKKNVDLIDGDLDDLSPKVVGF